MGRGLAVGMAMTIVLIGFGLLGAVLGLFYLKGQLESPLLARLAYSDLMMRFTVVAVALIALGVLLMLGEALP